MQFFFVVLFVLAMAFGIFGFRKKNLANMVVKQKDGTVKQITEGQRKGGRVAVFIFGLLFFILAVSLTPSSGHDVYTVEGKRIDFTELGLDKAKVVTCESVLRDSSFSGRARVAIDIVVPKSSDDSTVLSTALNTAFSAYLAATKNNIYNLGAVRVYVWTSKAEIGKTEAPLGHIIVGQWMPGDPVFVNNLALPSAH